MLVGDTTNVPLVAWLPLQPPEAVQVLAFVEDQASVELLPAVIEVGLAFKVTVGAAVAFTVTVAEDLTVPPVPVQESVYVVVLVGETAKLPLVASVPVQPPEAVHEVTFVLDQESVELLPEGMLVGFAVNVSIGLPGGSTVRTAVAAADPVAFLQVNVYVTL